MEINIEEILSNHSSQFKLAVEWKRQERVLISAKDVKASIKEIVEAVIDKCAEEAGTTTYSSDFLTPNGLISDTIIVDKDSILNVKTMIKYE